MEQKQSEPTMEEILASIRRIISEDGPAAPADEAQPAEGQSDDVLELTEVVAEEVAPGGPSQDEIDEIMGTSAPPAAPEPPRPAPAPRAAPPRPEPVTRAEPEPVWSEPVTTVADEDAYAHAPDLSSVDVTPRRAPEDAAANG